MILDAILVPLFNMVEWVFAKLPAGQPLDLPGFTSVTGTLAKVNSVIPIGPVMQVAVVLLGALVVFVIVRLILVVINIVWW